MILEIIHNIDPDIKVGNTVYMWDLSGSAIVGKEDILTPYSVYDLFGVDLLINQIPFTVVKTGIKNIATKHSNDSYWVRATDIIIQYNGVKVYTCSKFVRKLNK